MSRVLTSAENKYSTTKREALAVIQAMKWFMPYLWGTKFVLRTDHASLQWIFRQNNDGMIFRMHQKLQEFDFQVVHRPGENNGNADGLSRQSSKTPELSVEEQKQLFGDCPAAETLDDALGHIQLVSSSECENQQNDEKLKQFQNGAAMMLTFVRHELDDGIMEWEGSENDSTTQGEILSEPDESLLYEMSYRKLIDTLSNHSDFIETSSSEWSDDADSGSHEFSCKSTWESIGKVRLTEAATTMNYDSTDTNKMSLIIEEGREFAREKQMEDPTLNLIFSWADAQTKPTQPSLEKLRVKRSKAIAAGADAVALWSLWEQLELAGGVLQRKWLVEGKNSTIRQFIVPTSLRNHVLDQLHDSKISGGHFAFQKTLDRARQRF